MPTKQVMRKCTSCKKQTLHLQQTPNHILHLIMTLVTFGLWILVWIFQGSTTPKCTVCGKKNGALSFAIPNSTVEVESVISKKCPQCAEDVKKEAKVCRYCKFEFAENPTPERPKNIEAISASEQRKRLVIEWTWWVVMLSILGAFAVIIIIS